MASLEARGNSVRAVVRLPGGGKKAAILNTRLETEASADEIERKKDLGTLRSDPKITVEQPFETYLDAVASKMYSAK